MTAAEGRITARIDGPGTDFGGRSMPFRVSGKNIDVGEALRSRINQRVGEATAKYFDGGYSGHVTIGKEGFGFRTECAWPGYFEPGD